MTQIPVTENDPRYKYSCSDCTSYKTADCTWDPVMPYDIACNDITIRKQPKPPRFSYTPTALTLHDKIIQILTSNPGITSKDVEYHLRTDYNTYSHADSRLRELRAAGQVQSVKGSRYLRWYLT